MCQCKINVCGNFRAQVFQRGINFSSQALLSSFFTTTAGKICLSFNFCPIFIIVVGTIRRVIRVNANAVAPFHCPSLFIRDNQRQNFDVTVQSAKPRVWSSATVLENFASSFYCSSSAAAPASSFYCFSQEGNAVGDFVGGPFSRRVMWSFASLKNGRETRLNCFFETSKALAVGIYFN